MEGVVSTYAQLEKTTKDAAHCPFIVHQIHLKDLSLLKSERLREYALDIGGKRLAEAVALADGRASPTLKHARNASSASLQSMATSSGDSRRQDEIAFGAVLGLAKLAEAHR